MRALFGSSIRSVRKLAGVGARDWVLLVGCLPVVAAMRLGLTLLSYRRLRRLIPQTPNGRRKTSLGAGAAETRRIGWAVRNAARLVPAATCLTQALAAQYVLARSGRPSHVRVGVAHDARGRLLAHAWLICDGEIVVGGSGRQVGRYTHLGDFHLERS